MPENTNPLPAPSYFKEPRPPALDLEDDSKHQVRECERGTWTYTNTLSLSTGSFVTILGEGFLFLPAALI